MTRRLNELWWDLRMIFGSRHVTPRGPWAWFRWRVLRRTVGA